MTKDYKQIGIDLTIKKLKEEIWDLEQSIRDRWSAIAHVQDECEHPNVTKEHRTDRNYDEPGQVVSAWTEHTCPDCGKEWRGPKKEVNY